MAEDRNDELSYPEPPDGIVKPEQDSVVAFLDEPDAVESAMEQLVEAGFNGDRIYVLCGPKGAERLEWMSDEKGILFRAKDHLEGGGLVVSVPADEDHKADAARILGAHGGHGMAHFGSDHWEPLGA